MHSSSLFVCQNPRHAIVAGLTGKDELGNDGIPFQILVSITNSRHTNGEKCYYSDL